MPELNDPFFRMQVDISLLPGPAGATRSIEAFEDCVAAARARIHDALGVPMPKAPVPHHKPFAHVTAFAHRSGIPPHRPPAPFDLVSEFRAIDPATADLETRTKLGLE